MWVGNILGNIKEFREKGEYRLGRDREKEREGDYERQIDRGF